MGWDTLPQQSEFWGKNEYLEESREDVVQDFMRWFKDPTSEPAFFIQGAAGLGKSTLARHLTHRLNIAGYLAASVSLSVGTLPSNATTAEGVVKMTARKIGVIHSNAIPAIDEAIKTCHGAPLVDLIEMFLIRPIRSLGLSYPLAVLFDAVDEWEPHTALIKVLSSIPLPFPVKFVLLGRSDPRGPEFKDRTICSYLLKPVAAPVMERFLSKQLEGVRWDHKRGPAQWRIMKLAERANGWFVWAAIACSLIQRKARYSSPDQILDSILNAQKSLGEGDELSGLYHQAIMLLFPDAEGQDLLRKYLTATVALQEPLPIDEFSRFTSLHARAIETIQTRLTALQVMQAEPDERGSRTVYPARALFHLSFLEYLESMVTSKAQGDISFHAAGFDSHSQWAEYCLTELRRFLPSHRPLDLRELSHRGRYAVTYIMTHLHYGAPLVHPDSASQWQGSKNYAALRRIGTIELFEQWTVLFVNLVGPAPSTNQRAIIPSPPQGPRWEPGPADDLKPYLPGPKCGSMHFVLRSELPESMPGWRQWHNVLGRLPLR